METKTKILYPQLCYKINGLCFKTQKELGRFARERQYADKFQQLLKESGLIYQREVKLTEINDGSPDGNIADFIIDGKVILDFKAKKFITKEDYFQMQRYLKAAKLELGLIINFRSTYLKPKRILNSDYSH